MMKTITKNLSCRMRNAAFIAACFVTMIHYPFHGLNPLLRFFPSPLLDLALPAFFLMSGFCLGKHCVEKGWYGRELRKRFNSLLVPYVIWNLVAFLVACGMSIVSVRYFNGRGIQWNWRTIPNAFGLLGYDGPALLPYWYIRCIFVFILTLPVFMPLVLRSKRTAILTLLALYCLQAVGYFLYLDHKMYDHGPREFLRFIYSPEWLMYFLSGIACRLYDWPQVKGAWTIVLFVVGYCVTYCGYGCVVMPFYVLAAWQLVPSREMPKFLTSGTFAIFTFHSIIYVFVLSFGRHAFGLSFFTSIIGYWTTLSAVVVLSCFLGLILHKYFPRTAEIVFGGR